MLNWSKVTVRLGACGRVRCEPGWSLLPAWSDGLSDFDLWFVWAGRGEMRLRDERTVALQRGTCILARPGGTYVAMQDPSDRLGVTYIHFDLLDGRGHRVPAAELPAEVHEAPDPAYLETVSRRIVELIEGDDPEVAPEVQAAIATRLLTVLLIDLEARSQSQFWRSATPFHHRRLVLDAARRIRENPAGARIGLLAGQAGYTPDHFARVFRSVLGVAPQEYIVAGRIDRACQLLVESSLTVSQIGDALGYRDVYFFSRQFKQRTGLSPGKYRVRTIRSSLEGC